MLIFFGHLLLVLEQKRKQTNERILPRCVAAHRVGHFLLGVRTLEEPVLVAWHIIHTHLSASIGERCMS